MSDEQIDGNLPTRRPSQKQITHYRLGIFRITVFARTCCITVLADRVLREASAINDDDRGQAYNSSTIVALRIRERVFQPSRRDFQLHPAACSGCLSYLLTSFQYHRGQS